MGIVIVAAVAGFIGLFLGCALSVSAVSSLGEDRDRLRGKVAELTEAGELALDRLCAGCYHETTDCPANPEGCEAVRKLRAAVRGKGE
jgi:hypothetical protein